MLNMVSNIALFVRSYRLMALPATHHVLELYGAYNPEVLSVPSCARLREELPRSLCVLPAHEKGKL